MNFMDGYGFDGVTVCSILTMVWVTRLIVTTNILRAVDVDAVAYC